MNLLKELGKYILIFVLIMVVGFLWLIVLGPKNGASFSPANPASTAQTLPVVKPTAEPIGTSTAQASVANQLAKIDKLLSQSMLASIAFNAPSAMELYDTTTIDLFMNPSQSPTQVAGQVTQPGQVVTATVEITPRTRAELFSKDKDAFEIQSMQVSDEQVISETETTHWSWFVTARKSGQQNLTLVIYRLVKYDGQDYWREVQAYKADINVKVTLASQLKSLDLKWVTATLITAIIIPAFWRWVDHRKKRRTAKNILLKHKK